MGCKPSKASEGVNQHGNHTKVFAIGQTERHLSKMQKSAVKLSETTTTAGTVTTANTDVDENEALTPDEPKLDHQGYLLPEEVAKRTFSSITNHEAALGTEDNLTHVQFATWTQRGYYPDDPHKKNQDKFGTHLKFAGVKNDAMFAVYDGHGSEGHSCAQFAKEKLPKTITKHVRKVRCQKYQNELKQENGLGKKKGWDPDNWPMLDEHEYEQCCVKAFLEVNQAMHSDPQVPDKLSGTTATTVCFHGDLVCIGNVGDSRVVLGHRVKGNATANGPVSTYHPSDLSLSAGDEEEKTDIDDEIERESIKSEETLFLPRISPPGTSLLAIPLSRDQTPYRKDERERVKKLGASIMSIDQMQGKEELHDNWGDMVLGEAIDTEGDSPRVWVEGKDYPGCAFTRSLGDKISEEIGVIAEPEMLTTRLTMNDEFLVIASDGIFEFLTNQVVIDMCASSESPLEACEKIVRQAYQQWLVYERRTDDITIIVCFLQNLTEPPIDGTKGTTEDLIATTASVYGVQPNEFSPAAKAENVAPILKTNETSSERSNYPAEVFLTASPAPPMAFADFDDTDVVDVKLENLMEEANLSKSSGRSVRTQSSFKEDSPATSESPENEEATTTRNAIRI